MFHPHCSDVGLCFSGKESPRRVGRVAPRAPDGELSHETQVGLEPQIRKGSVEPSTCNFQPATNAACCFLDLLT
jgi:hypothetical protein